MAGKVLAKGDRHHVHSAQECCDKCKEQARGTRGRGCNVWTFCPLPSCWGIDAKHNHTFGECWLRWVFDIEPKYTQRGKYSMGFRTRFSWIRRGRCRKNQHWSCMPTHVPWTSGMVGNTPTTEEKQGMNWLTGSTLKTIHLSGGGVVDVLAMQKVDSSEDLV